MGSLTRLFSGESKVLKWLVFLLGMALLSGSWIMLFSMESMFTESHLVGYTCCVSEQELPAPGTLERGINDFFRTSPGQYLPSLFFLLVTAGLAAATSLTARNIFWVPWLLLSFNLLYFAMDLVLVTTTWSLADWLLGPQASVYKGYQRTLYGIVAHLLLWTAYFMVQWQARQSLKRPAAIF